MDGAGESRTLGEALRRRRLELGWTQETLAARVTDLGGDLRQSDVSRLERGKIGLPRRDRLARIAAALDLSLGELLARSGWAGADDVFDQPATAPPAEVRSEPRLDPAAPNPTSPAIPASRPEPTLSPRLRTAIDQAHALEAWSADVLRRAAVTFERANRPLPGQEVAPPPRPNHDKDRS